MKQSELFSTDYYSEFLEHHGIDGQKWGHRNGPPYPLTFSKHSKAEKKAMRSGDSTVYGKKKKVKKSKNDKPLRDYKDLSDEDREKAKREAVRRGDVKETNKNRDYFSDKDIQDVLNRYDLNKRLSQRSVEDIKTSADKIQQAFRTMDTVKTGAEKALAVWNATANIINTFTDMDLPTSNNGKNNKDNKNGKNKNNNNNSNDKNHKYATKIWYVNGKEVSRESDSTGVGTMKYYKTVDEDKRKPNNQSNRK